MIKITIIYSNTVLIYYCLPASGESTEVNFGKAPSKKLTNKRRVNHCSSC